MSIEVPLYDAAIVPGRGFKKDYLLPASSRSTVEEAVERFKKGEFPYVIFSGKYSWHENDFPPPLTEAKAMATYAEELGLKETACLIEDESQTTVANLCLVKERFYLPKRLKSGLIIGVYPHTNRIALYAEYVFGPGYDIQTVATKYEFPSEIHAKVIIQEEEKFRNAEKWLSQFEKGDHETIFREAQLFINSPITSLSSDK